MPRFKLTIEYAGTRYSGWQIQNNARTIQGELDRAVRAVTRRKDFELYGSGRTDAGVHALAQVAHLDVSTLLPAETLRQRLNDELPPDINVLGIGAVPHRFHARHDAVARRYLYQIARRRTAFAKAYVWWVKEAIAVAPMRAAAPSFVGMRDFKAFSEVDRGRNAPRDEDELLETSEGRTRSTLVLLERLDIVEEGDLVLVRVDGSHFLWKMVRRVVGVLIEVGRGNMSPQDATALLASSSDVPARLTAPPSGLFLERVYYKGDVRSDEIRPATPLARLEQSR
jgi:tRNA pseudouridine38-40 synthase